MATASADRRYDIIRKLARGGMGEVYLAQQTGIEGFAKEVVIKRIHGDYSEDPDFVKMFLQEARIAAMLDHPNIVQIYELGRQGNAYFIVMEHVQGLSLSRLMKACPGPLPLPVAVQITINVAQGLGFAHELTGPDGLPLNLVHRDISPPNILLSTSGSVKITDFGIAKVRQSVTQTEAGVIKGKWSYISPERARGEPATASSDIYSLGLVLYEMTTGVRAYPLGASDRDLLLAVASGRIPPPETHVADYPQDLRSILMRTLQPGLKNRYDDCQQLHDDLEELLVERAIVTSPAKLGQFVQQYVSEPSLPDLAGLSATPASGARAELKPAEVVQMAPLVDEPGTDQQAGAQDDLAAMAGTASLFDPDVETVDGAGDQEASVNPLAPTMPVQAVGGWDTSQPDNASVPEPETGSLTNASGQLQDPVQIASSGRWPWIVLGAVAVLVGATVLTWALLRSPGPASSGALSAAAGQQRGAVDGAPLTSRVDGTARSAATADAAPATQRDAAVDGAVADQAAAQPDQRVRRRRHRRRHRGRRHRRRPPTPKKPPPPRNPTTVNLTTSPQVDVFVAGRHLGRSPLTFTVAKGRTKLSLRNKSVGLNTTRLVRTQASTISLRFVFGKGTLKFAIPGGSRVTLDGRDIGQDPRSVNIYEGLHRVVLQLPDGRKVKRLVVVKPYASTTCTVR